MSQAVQDVKLGEMNRGSAIHVQFGQWEGEGLYEDSPVASN